MLAEFRLRYPEIVVDVSFEDRVVDLVEEGYDLALRVARESSLAPGLIARLVRPVPFFIAASRDYLKRHDAPKSPEELAHHDFVAIGNIDAISLTGSRGKIEVPLRVVLRYRSMAGVANAVAAGIGLAPLPDILFEEPEFNGILTPVLTGYPIQGPTLYIVYVSRKVFTAQDPRLHRFFGATGQACSSKPAYRYVINFSQLKTNEYKSFRFSIGKIRPRFLDR